MGQRKLASAIVALKMHSNMASGSSKPLFPRLRATWLTLLMGVIVLVLAVSAYLHETAQSKHPWNHAVIRKFPLQLQQKNRAFATYLTGGSPDEHYFTAVRTLVYQVLYAPETRTQQGYDMIVFVADSVPQDRRKRLEEDGAKVIKLEHLGAEWAVPTHGRWADVMTKLRMWEQTDYGLIAFIDGDTLLLQNPDGIFDDPAVRELKPRKDVHRVPKAPHWEPESYVMAGIVQINEDHDFPPLAVPKDRPNPTFFNAGLMVFKPSLQVMRYYEELLKTPNSFDPGLPEQGLLNHLHERDGPLPATFLDPIWNCQYAKANDVKHGVRMLHDKWWNLTHPEYIEPLFQAWNARADSFHKCKEAQKYLDAPC